MQSEHLADHFQCHFDDQNIDSGFVYTDTFTHCIGETQQTNAGFKLYSAWYDGSATGKKNLLMRALTLNYQDYAETLDAIYDGGLRDATGLSAISLSKDGIKRISKVIVLALQEHQIANAQSRTILDSLLGKLLTRIARVTTAATKDSHLVRGLVAHGLISKMAVLKVNFTGNVSQFVANTAAAGMHAATAIEGSRDFANVEKAVAERMKILRILDKDGLNLRTTQNATIWIAADEIDDVEKALKQRQEKDLYKYLTPEKQRIRAIVNAIRGAGTAEDLRVLQMEHWGRRVDTGAQIAAQRAMKELPLAGPLFAGILQVTLLYGSIYAMENALARGVGITEASARLIAYTSGTISAAGEVLEQLIKRLGKEAWTFRLGRTQHVGTTFFNNIYRRFGIASSVIIGVVEAYHANEARLDGEKGLAAAHLAVSSSSFIYAYNLYRTGVLTLIMNDPIAVAAAAAEKAGAKLTAEQTAKLTASRAAKVGIDRISKRNVYLWLIFVIGSITIWALHKEPLERWLSKCILGTGTIYDDAEEEMLQLKTVIDEIAPPEEEIPTTESATDDASATLAVTANTTARAANLPVVLVKP